MQLETDPRMTGGLVRLLAGPASHEALCGEHNPGHRQRPEKAQVGCELGAVDEVYDQDGDVHARLDVPSRRGGTLCVCMFLCLYICMSAYVCMCV